MWGTSNSYARYIENKINPGRVLQHSCSKFHMKAGISPERNLLGNSLKQFTNHIVVSSVILL